MQKTVICECTGVSGYILKKWFDEPKDILERLVKQNIKYIHQSEDNIVFLWKQYVVYLHNSIGEDLRRSEKIKVFVWEVFGDEFEDAKEYHKWEDKLGEEFEKFFSL